MDTRFGRTLLITAVLTAVLAVSPSGRADAEAGPTFAGGQQVAPHAGHRSSSLSYNGTKTLVVWEQKVGSNYDVYGRVMAPDTTTIDDPFRISTRALNDVRPDVAWNGSSWLVVWEYEEGLIDSDIRGRRVSAAGDLLGSELAISTAPDYQEGPAVAAGPDGQFLAVWVDFRNRHTTSLDVYGQRISGTGARSDGNGRRLSRDTSSRSRGDLGADVAWNGSVYLTVFESIGSDDVIHGVALRPDATRVFSGPLAGPSGPEDAAGNAAVASDGTDFLLVYEQLIAGSNTGLDIDGRIIDGEDLAGAPTFAITHAGDFQGDPAVAFNGSYLVAWVNQRDDTVDVWGARVRADGTVVDPDGVALAERSPVHATPAVTGGGTRANTFGLSWDQTPAGRPSGVAAVGVQFAPK